MTEHWSGLALAICTDRAVLGPDGAGLVLRLIAAAERVAHRDGIGLSPQLVQLRNVLRPVADERHRDGVEPVTLRTLPTQEITTREAAQMLALSIRQTQRLTDGEAFGPVRRVGRGYLIPRAEVGAFIARRKETE